MDLVSAPTDTGVKHGPYLRGDGPQRPDGMPAQIPNPYLTAEQRARLEQIAAESGNVRTDTPRR